MTPPTPAAAAVINAMARSLTDVETVRPHVGPDYESSASIDRRTLASHIRAIAQEMRDHAEKYESDGWYTAGESLRVFADKLEGKQP